MIYQKKHYGLFVKKENKFGETQSGYTIKSRIVDLFSKTFIGVVCGLYSFEPLFGEKSTKEIIANVIWNTLQIILWLALGLLSYINAKSFIVDEYRQTHIIQKTEYLNEFVITMKNNPNIVDTYDDYIELDKDIAEFIANKEMVKNEEPNNEQKGVLD